MHVDFCICLTAAINQRRIISHGPTAGGGSKGLFQVAISRDFLTAAVNKRKKESERETETERDPQQL